MLLFSNFGHRQRSRFIAMLRRYFLPLLTLLAGINGVNSQAQPIRILYPDRHGLEFYSQDAINVSYETNFTEPYLYVWCSQGVASRKQYHIISNVLSSSNC